MCALSVAPVCHFSSASRNDCQLCFESTTIHICLPALELSTKPSSISTKPLAEKPCGRIANAIRHAMLYPRLQPGTPKAPTNYAMQNFNISDNHKPTLNA